MSADLETIATTPTERVAIRRQWIDRALPQYAGVPAPADIDWAIAHSDCHFANFITSGPTVLDFGGFGLAPVGYDPALLYAYSLLAPQTTNRIRTAFPSRTPHQPHRTPRRRSRPPPIRLPPRPPPNSSNYLNGGPGSPAFVYVAQRHQEAAHQPLSGWHGHADPFAFTTDYRPATGIKRFQCSTPNCCRTRPWRRVSTSGSASTWNSSGPRAGP
ncbi:phosphotransferase [Streptomyces sp. NPDC048248]|uniref:phosphotransferase n=1 Tax=Streptomyces sp. NPDC048248 TaxID=3365523 RepID=UPI003714C8F9